jgi:uncharacterized protein (UPF0276 family)
MAGLAGVSFKHEHLAAFLAEARQDVFFEVHAEKLYGCRGAAQSRARALRRDHTISLHERACRWGVRNLSTVTLGRFQTLVERYARLRK